MNNYTNLAFHLVAAANIKKANHPPVESNLENAKAQIGGLVQELTEVLTQNEKLELAKHMQELGGDVESLLVPLIQSKLPELMNAGGSVKSLGPVIAPKLPGLANAADGILNFVRALRDRGVKLPVNKSASFMDKLDSGIEMAKSLPGKVQSAVDAAGAVPQSVAKVLEKSKNERLLKELLMGGIVGGGIGLGGTLLTEGDNDNNKTKHRLRNFLLGIGGGATVAGLQHNNRPRPMFLR